MRENVLDSVGVVLAALLRRGEFDSKSPAWDTLQDEEVLVATEAVLLPMHARVAVTQDRCFLVPTDPSSPFLKGTTRMRDVFRDKEKDDPGRLNLLGVITLLILHKLLDDKSEDGLSQAGRGGMVPVSVMVDECEDALATLSRQEGLSDYMTSALSVWDRSSRPSSGRANITSHEGHVHYALRGLKQKGIILMDENGEDDQMATFAPTQRLLLQAREVLNAERYQEIVAALEEGEE